MKTKIKLLLVGLLSLATLITSSVAVADSGAFNDGQTCEGKTCQQFHEDGISFNGPFGTGLTFPSFNNYFNYPTADGRQFDERQFVYIEKARAQFSGMPYPAPWDNYPAFQFSASDTQHELFFTGEPNEKKRFGMWVYMHNNAIGGQNIFAEDVSLNVDRWGSVSPQLSFSPRAVIGSSNTKPKTIWADIDITSNDVPFTLVPVEAFISKKEGYTTLAPADVTQLTHDGVNIKTGSTTRGKFNSSQDYYVVVYLEFEATPVPQAPKECRSLEIVSPNGANDGNSGALIFGLPTVDTDEAFDNLPLAIQVDTDDNVVANYHYFVNGSNGLKLSETPNGPQSRELFTNQEDDTVYLNGIPNDRPNDPQQISVAAVDDENIWLSPCGDGVKFVYQPDEEESVCEDFDTNPGSLGGQPVPLNTDTLIQLDGPVDNNGNPFQVNGDPAMIQYCFSNTDITFSPSIWQTSPQCAQAPSNIELTVIPTTPGTMTMDVLGTDVADCADSFDTEENQYGGVCLNLQFEQDLEFNGIDEYCVDIEVESTVVGYNNNIEWTVIRDGSDYYTAQTQGDPCIDLNDHGYSWLPGDSLEAVALIQYENEDCEDLIISDEDECTKFKLKQREFERGRDNEICVDDTDWPIQSTGVYVSVDGDDEFLVDVDEDDCFILEEEDLDGADDVEVWVPEWEDECNDDLNRIVQPPEFDKNVKDEDASSSSFSSRAAINFSDNNVDYKITYEHKNDEEQDVTITDTIGREGYIQGYISNATSNLNNAPEGGRIYYENGSMNVWVEGEGNIHDCDDTSDDVCYNGNIGDRDGVEIENVPPRKEVVVTYSGEVDTVVSPSNCSDPNHPLVSEGAVCGEIYPNTADFDDEAGFDGSHDADVLIPCPFIIIRSGGEVFLENPFDYGVDTLSCSEIENVPVPIITPDYDTPDLVSTGEGESILTAFSDRLCKNEDVEGYQDIERISSLICEVTLKTSEDLTQFAIVQNIARNIQLFARYGDNLKDTSVVDGSNGLPESSSKVYVKKDSGDLTLGGTFENGAQTIVVIGGNVKINKDIKFRDPANLNDPRQIPSLAVIVIGGDILVAPGVKETNGVFFVQEGEDGEGGEMCEGTCAENDQYNENPLVHYGSIYGDIQHLFKYRTFAGDPTKDEAAILIRFDNRIYLNTPPILGELVNVTQEVF